MLHFRRSGSLALTLIASIGAFAPIRAQALEATAAQEEPVPPNAADDPVRQLTAWIAASGDNNQAPFIIIDKVAAKVFAFDSQQRPVGETPALLGVAVGDDSAPGVGNMKLAAIPRKDRTTPAGRFVAKLGWETGNKEVLWVDY